MGGMSSFVGRKTISSLFSIYTGGRVSFTQHEKKKNQIIKRGRRDLQIFLSPFRRKKMFRQSRPRRSLADSTAPVPLACQTFSVHWFHSSRVDKWIYTVMLV
jgi:hypothetical protein